MIETLKVILDAAAILISLAALGVVVFANYGKSARSTASKEDVRDLWTEVGGIRNQVAQHSATLLHMPSSQTVTRLEGEMQTLTAKLEALKGSIDGLESWLGRVDTFLRRE